MKSFWIRYPYKRQEDRNNSFILLPFIDPGVVLCAVLRECVIENHGELENGGH